MNSEKETELSHVAISPENKNRARFNSSDVAYKNKNENQKNRNIADFEFETKLDHSLQSSIDTEVTFDTLEVDPKGKNICLEKCQMVMTSPFDFIRKYTIFPGTAEQIKERFVPWYPVSATAAAF